MIRTLEYSVKDFERKRRLSKAPLELQEISKSAPLPVNMESFWALNASKHKSEVLIHMMLIETAQQEYSQLQIVCSEICCESSLPCMSVCNEQYMELPGLKKSIDEADERIVLHVKNALEYNYTTALILSSDSDVSILLYYWDIFKEMGLSQL